MVTNKLHVKSNPKFRINYYNLTKAVNLSVQYFLLLGESSKLPKWFSCYNMLKNLCQSTMALIYFQIKFGNKF